MGNEEICSGEAVPLAPTSNKTANFSNDFRILNVFNDGFNMTVSLQHSRDPLFYVRNSFWSFRKPDVTLSVGLKKGPILGGLRLAFFHQASFCLGDPSGKQVAYEQLRQTSTWCHNRYEFECGEAGNRHTYVWIRTAMPFWGDQPDLELREKVPSRFNGDQVSAVLATYRGLGRQAFNWSGMRGVFSIRKDVDSAMFGEKGGLPNWSDWELAVLLTACGLIEASRRRARSRRAAQHGLPFSS